MSACADTVNPALQRVVLATIGVQVDVQFKQGTEPDQIRFRPKNADGTLVDLTGATGVAKIRKTVDAATSPAAWVVTVVDGWVVLTLPVAQSAALGVSKDARDATGQYVWDCIVTYGGTPKPALYGSLLQLQSSSR